MAIRPCRLPIQRRSASREQAHVAVNRGVAVETARDFTQNAQLT